jgi:hypothetical protein
MTGLSRTFVAVVTACLLAPCAGQGQSGPPALSPGEYVTEGGWGVLTLKKERGQGIPFALEAVGANGHVCSLDGEIRNGRSVVSAEGSSPECIVSFVVQGESIDVAGNGVDSCHDFCGARAGFEGRYVRAPAGCSSAERAKSQETFNRLYKERKLSEASTALAPLLERCARTLSWLEDGSVRNDLAITQYHLGRYAECLETLSPLADDAAKSEDELRENLPPSDFESFLPIVNATRTNLRLCRSRAAAR